MARGRTVRALTDENGSATSAKPEAARGEATAEDPAAIPCRVTADLYSRAGRRAIGRLLAKPLQAWGLTPIELLHDLEAYRRLSNAGSSLQNAVQRAAVAQVAETGEPVSERIRALYEVIDAAVRELHTRSQSLSPEQVSPSFEETTNALEYSADREFLLAMALTAQLRPEKDTTDKFNKLVRLFHENLPSWASAVLDRFLSERLVEGGVLEQRLASDSLARRLERYIRLGKGGLREPLEADDPLRRINEAIAQRRLPETCTHIVEHVFETLAASRRATGDGLNDEFAALSSLLEAAGEGLSERDGYPALQTTFEERCARLLNPQALSAYLDEAVHLVERIDRLLDLAQSTIGERNLATIAEHVAYLLEDRDNRDFWIRPVGASLEQRMKTAARLQQKILASRLPETHRERLAGQLDRLCVELLERSAVIERIQTADSPSVEKGKRLLKLLGEAHVTRGVAARRVRAAVQRCLADPEVLACLEQATANGEQATLARELHRLLQKAGFGTVHDAT